MSHQKSLTVPSRLKGMETFPDEPLFREFTVDSLPVPSRLKGMETRVAPPSLLGVSVRLTVPSRLKGMGTRMRQI